MAAESYSAPPGLATQAALRWPAVAERVDYELTEAEAQFLEAVTANALAEAGAKGGEVGGAVGGGVGGALGGGVGGALGGGVGGASGGRSGGAKGGRFGVRFTKPVTAETTLEVEADAEAARERAQAVIAADGAPVDDPNGVPDDAVWGIVGSGAKDMVPALVKVTVETTAPGRTRVHVRATGREGLIKQKIGAKAADRIASAIATGTS
jgi:hypothetical protein